MARQAAILAPNLTRQFGNMNVMRPPVTDGSNTFKANSLVYLVSGVLTLIPTDGVLLYGQTPDKNHASTDLPPDILPRPVGEGELHYCFSPLDAEFEINLGTLSGTAIVIGASAAKPADVAIGGVYGIATPTTGTYAGTQFLDPTETTATLFQVTGFVDGVLSDDQNGRVRCKVIASKIQN